MALERLQGILAHIFILNQYVKLSPKLEGMCRTTILIYGIEIIYLCIGLFQC